MPDGIKYIRGADGLSYPVTPETVAAEQSRPKTLSDHIRGAAGAVLDPVVRGIEKAGDFVTDTVGKARKGASEITSTVSDMVKNDIQKVKDAAADRANAYTEAEKQQNTNPYKPDPEADRIAYEEAQNRKQLEDAENFRSTIPARRDSTININNASHIPTPDEISAADEDLLKDWLRGLDNFKDSGKKALDFGMAVRLKEARWHINNRLNQIQKDRSTKIQTGIRAQAAAELQKNEEVARIKTLDPRVQELLNNADVNPPADYDVFIELLGAIAALTSDEEDDSIVIPWMNKRKDLPTWANIWETM